MEIGSLATRNTANVPLVWRQNIAKLDKFVTTMIDCYSVQIYLITGNVCTILICACYSQCLEVHFVLNTYSHLSKEYLLLYIKFYNTQIQCWILTMLTCVVYPRMYTITTVCHV